MEGSDPAPTRAELSKTPSWIMVGFVLGVLAVWGFRRERASVTPSPAPAIVQTDNPPSEPRKSVTALEDRPSLVAIEAVFASWGDYALWEDERTEVALWNSATNEFSDFFEVLRTPAGLFFRSIPRLTRPWTDARPPRESPLRYTEPLAQRKARLEGRLSPQPPVSGGQTGPWKGPERDSTTERAPIAPLPVETPRL